MEVIALVGVTYGGYGTGRCVIFIHRDLNV